MIIITERAEGYKLPIKQIDRNGLEYRVKRLLERGEIEKYKGTWKEWV